MCILHCLRYLIMEFLVSRLVEDFVMGPITSWLLGDEGGEDSAEGGWVGRREEHGGSSYDWHYWQDLGGE